MITNRGSSHVGDGVATLTDIDGTGQFNGCHATLVECTDGPQAGGRVVGSLRDSTTCKRDSRRQLVGQGYAGCLSSTAIGDAEIWNVTESPSAGVASPESNVFSVTRSALASTTTDSSKSSPAVDGSG